MIGRFQTDRHNTATLIERALPSSRDKTTVFSYLRLLLPGYLIPMLVSCDYVRDRSAQWDPAAHIQSQSFNYTPHDIRYVLLEDATEPFDVNKAVLAGPAGFQRMDGADIVPGVQVSQSHATCCFNWRYGAEERVALQVKWLAVFDREAYEEAERKTDDRSLRGALPGSEWCQANVVIPKPYPARPDILSVHFLPDGVLKIRISDFHAPGGEGPLPAADVLAHGRHVETPLCPASSVNPWYNVPRPKHRE
jgi:hypothetical protein